MSMFIPRVYYPHDLQENTTIEFDKETSHYLTTVLRLRSDETIILFNGQGGEYTATLQAHPKKSQAHIRTFTDTNRQSPLPIYLGQGLVRGDRMDFVIQKATELGIHQITPLITEKSAIKLDEDRKEKRASHWHKIAVSACEQCGMNLVPQITPTMSVIEWAKQPFAGISVIFEPGSKTSLQSLKIQGPIRIAIGPESGWSTAEVEQLIGLGFQPLHLGPRVLRTETAGLVALSILQGCFGDLA